MGIRIFEDKNIAVFNEDLDNLLEIEIKNVVSGNIIFDLKEVMEEKAILIIMMIF